MDSKLLTRHKIKGKEYLIKICKQYGVKNWRAVYDADYNKDFRKKFPNPDYILPDYYFRVPDKKKLVKAISEAVKEKKKQAEELKKMITDVKKAKKATEQRIVRQAQKYESDYLAGRSIEALAMMFLPIGGAAKAVVKGTEVTTRSIAAMLTLKSISLTKMTVSVLDKESNVIVKTLQTANDWTSPSYWMVSGWSDQGMDHNKFQKKAREQIKKLGKQSDQFVTVLEDAIKANGESTKQLESTRKELDRL